MWSPGDSYPNQDTAMIKQRWANWKALFKVWPFRLADTSYTHCQKSLRFLVKMIEKTVFKGLLALKITPKSA
jgi:hypothetical protein